MRIASILLSILCIAGILYGCYAYTGYQQLLEDYYQLQDTLNNTTTIHQNKINAIEDSLNTYRLDKEAQVTNLEAKIKTLEAELAQLKPTSGRAWLTEHTYVVKANNEPVTLIDYPNNTNPTWERLKTFLKEDKTERLRYIEGSYTCADFAERLHNEAERVGIKTAFIAVNNHALNAFMLEGHSQVTIIGIHGSKPITSAGGLVYIDCTGTTDGTGVDTIAEVWQGKEYKLTFLWDEDKLKYENVMAEGIGTIKELTVIWKGRSTL